MSGLFRSFLFASHRIAPACARDISLAARDTISGFLLEPGDTLRFKLRNGQSAPCNSTPPTPAFSSPS